MNLQAIKDAQQQFDRLLILHEAKAPEEEIEAQASRTVNALVLAQHQLNGHHKVEVDVEKVAPRAVDVLAEHDEPKAWVIGGLLEERCRMLLYGPSYVGKSLVAWFAAICVARGFGGVLNHGVDAPPANAVLFYGENSRRQVRNALRKLLDGEPCPETLRLVEVHAQSPVPDLASPHGQAWYEAVLAQLKPRLAVLDTSTSLVLADRNKAEVASGVMNWLSAMGRRHGTAFIVVHHVRKGTAKGDEGSPADKAYGGQEWTALADTACILEREGERGAKVHAWKIRDEAGDDAYIAAIDPDTLRMEFVAPMGRTKAQPRAEPGEAVRRLARKLHEVKEWMTAADLSELLDVHIRPIQRNLGSAAFAKWIADGFFETEKPAAENLPTRYRSTGALPPELIE